MIYKTDKKNIESFFNDWAETYSLYVPSEAGELVPYSKDLEISWEKVPVWGGIKEFVIPGRNPVTGLLDEEKDEKPVMLAGDRGCDLRGLVEVLDRIFLEQEPVDSVYKKLRDSLTLILVDCAKPAGTCFCAAVSGKPYADKGFDINLSFLDDGVIAETGSEKGEELLKDRDMVKAGDKIIKEREKLRKSAYRSVKLNFNQDYKSDNYREKIENNTDKKYWEEKSADCMLCGGCNFACPTCYCSLLDEVSGKKDIRKILQWDGCQFKGYARVGGGANPRPELWERFRYRHLCKFRIMDEEFDIPGCVGCGRCITVCPADIDIRDTVKGLL